MVLLLAGAFVGYTALKICVIILAVGTFCTALRRLAYTLARLSETDGKDGE